MVNPKTPNISQKKPYSMRRLIFQTLAAVLLSGATAFAGSYTNTFNDPTQPGITLSPPQTDNVTGSPYFGLTYPTITNGELIFTYADNSQASHAIMDDLDAGAPIDSFTATFQLQFGPGTATPADGFGFAFGPDVGSASVIQEEGVGGGQPGGGVAVTWDTYDNGAAANGLPTDPVAIEAWSGGFGGYINIVQIPFKNTVLVDSQTHNVMIRLKPNGTLSVVWNGIVICTNRAVTGWAPSQGQFGFGARTGGLNELCFIKNLVITTGLAPANPTAPAIVTAPANMSVPEGSAATFTVDYSGTPPFTYQWFSNNVAIADGTNDILTLSNLTLSASGSAYSVALTNAQGFATSQAGTLTVIADTNRPSILSAVDSSDFTHVTVTFSRPVTQASAQTTANYTIAGLTVVSAAQSTNNAAVVVLTTSSQKEGTAYTLTINNIKDTTSSGNLISPNSQIAFTSPVFIVTGAGALSSTNGTSFDVGVSFSIPPSQAAETTIANYHLSSGTVTAVTLFTNSPEVVLTATGLAVGSNYTVTVSGLTDSVGNAIPATNLSFTVSKMQWGVVGADQLQLGNGVVPVAANGFDIYSDGIAEWGNYDETTFVYEKINGDFDKKLRVEYQDPSSEWARAGLIARDVPDFGVDAATQEGSQPGNTPAFPYDGTAGRYQKIHVNPVGPTLTGPGTLGNALWEGNRRLDTGGGCTTALTGANSAPQYPHAWCRLQRVGQVFTIYRSDDGVNWINLGKTTWGVDDMSKTNMPATLYVGPEFSPENGNIAAAFHGMFVAKMRDYGDVTSSVGAPTLTFQRTQTGLTVTYTGTLQSADVVTGPWSNVPGASSPFTVTPSAPEKFYRAGP